MCISRRIKQFFTRESFNRLKNSKKSTTGYGLASMASRFPPTSISGDEFRNSDEEFDENDSDIDFTGLKGKVG